MTLKSEIPVPIDDKIHRIYHQHHHHHYYHLHHILDHHHLHIHNQSIFRSHVSPPNQHHGTDVAIYNQNPSQVAVNSTVNNQPFEQYTSRRIATSSTSPSRTKKIRFLLVSAFAYILSPIDLIPEAVFGVFGILDDLIFLLMCLFCIAIILLYPLFRELTLKKCAILKAACRPSTVCRQLGGLTSASDNRKK
jgi:uncharacterized membrane protein YkvA (DUF1232 family)